MTVALAAIGRGDIAAYVSALFTVYIVLIFIRILMSWIPSLPATGPAGAVIGFIRETTDPYLNFFRRFLPPVGGSGFALDLSPILGILLLVVMQAVVVGVVRG